MTGSNAAEDFTILASGVVWDTRGHVVTAYSPVNPSFRQQQKVAVVAMRPDGSLAICPATAIAREPSLDLIVLQVDALAENANSVLQPAPLASSSQLRIGQDLLLLGSTPQGRRTLSVGVLSATGRSIPAPNGQQIRGTLQTDADVTALGLGGALLDSSGRLAGIPTTSYSRPGTGRSSGVNFALPSDLLVDAVPKLIAYGNLVGRR